MGKLSDRIKRATRTAPTPIGFHTRSDDGAAEPTMLCIVRLESKDTGKISDAVAKGADVVIVDDADAGKLKKELEKSEGAICGAGTSGDRSDVAALRDAGADFAVVDLESASAEALLEEKIGYALSVPLDADEVELRLIADLPLDALIVGATGKRPSLRDALKIRRVAALGRTALFVEVDPESDTSTLQALRENGVVGAMVDGSSIGKLDKLRERIASLPKRGRRREESSEATLPAGVAAGGDDDYDEDDWDD